MKNRTIKFRKWSKNTQGKYRMEHVFDYDEMSKNPKHYDAVYMQFTGLKDKNGKEIYEGDIVKVFAEDLGTESICEMKWIDHGFSPTDKDGKHYGLFFPLTTYKLEVIGNIYENPELLASRRDK